MKTLKFNLLVLLMVTSTQIISYAGENEGSKDAYDQLNAQLKAMINKISAESQISSENPVFLVLTFSVNGKSEIENITVESSNDALAKKVKRTLSKEKVKVSPLLDGKRGQVAVEISNEG